jgi:plastocyanin
MLRPGTRGRRFSFTAALLALGAMVYAAIALASPPIVGQGTDTYSAPTYTISQGEVAQFQVTGSTHNVTAHQSGPDAGPLFRSATISGGFTPVNGTQYLTAGAYTFYCSVHPSMQATLDVSSTGTPVARPTATLSVRTKTISKALKKGLLVAIDMSAKTDGVSLLAKLGKATIGKASDISTAAGQQFAVLKLTKSGKSKLSQRSKATVTVSATIPFGPPASSKAKLK